MHDCLHGRCRLHSPQRADDKGRLCVVLSDQICFPLHVCVRVNVCMLCRTSLHDVTWRSRNRTHLRRGRRVEVVMDFVVRSLTQELAPSTVPPFFARLPFIIRFTFLSLPFRFDHLQQLLLPRVASTPVTLPQDVATALHLRCCEALGSRIRRLWLCVPCNPAA